MKLFLTLVLLSTPMLVFAQPPTPGVSVWAEPKEVAIGKPLTLSALVYNTQKDTVTVTVTFTTPLTTYGEPVRLSIPPATAKTAAVSITQPEDRQVVTATVTSAVNSKKEPIVSLEGPLGAVTIGPEKQDPFGSLSGVEASLKRMVSVIRTDLEAFRSKQAAHFIALRGEKKELMQKPVEVPESFFEEGEKPLELYSTKHSMFDYITLVTATALATFFGQSLLFYIALFLITFFLVRFVFRLLV